MRIITLHCDYIRFKPLKKAIKNIEDLKEKEKKEITVKDPLVVLTAVEKGDNDKIVNDYIESIKKTAGEVKAKNIVLYPYAHLSSNLSNPDTAKGYLTLAEHTLEKEGFSVTKAPFGYYKEFELKVKGHPLSELSKEFRLEEMRTSELKTDLVRKEEESVDISKLLREISRSKLDTSKLKENDHRILGQKLDLFSFNETSPGSVFWHPKGLVIYNGLISFLRTLLTEGGYQEISTPQILDNKLWKVSGHWSHYKDNMFLTSYENRDFGVKPMSCPGGMLIYKASTKSYRDLPLRLSEFGVVHRKELSGVLAGLFRVVKFTQDDAHLFVTKEQIQEEITSILELVKKIYEKTFNFEYRVELSTRPDKFMGEVKDWDYAEDALESALKKIKVPYKVNKADGAFYGPKIDIHIKDSLGRSWQCGTIQLDMQMPKRFETTYTDKDNSEKTPLVIHRAIFGSLERFIGILLEHLNGALPLWLSPVQVRVINFTDRNNVFAEKVIKNLKAAVPGLRIDSDFRNTTVNDKIRDAEMQKVPCIIVIGDKEEQNNTLAVRERGSNKPKFGVKIDDFIKDISKRIQERN